MPIEFSIHRDEGYLIATYRGVITDEILLSAWMDLYTGEEWIPGLSELNDFSEADASGVTVDALRELSCLARSVFENHGLDHVRCAVYTPQTVHFGLARMYEALVDEDSPESVRVFRDRDEAIAWVKQLPQG